MRSPDPLPRLPDAAPPLRQRTRGPDPGGLPSDGPDGRPELRTGPPMDDVKQDDRPAARIERRGRRLGLDWTHPSLPADVRVPPPSRQQCGAPSGTGALHCHRRPHPGEAHWWTGMTCDDAHDRTEAKLT